VFSSDGLFLFTVAKKGKDKGDYSVVTDIAVSDENIAILDNNRKTLMIYDSNGKFQMEMANRPGKKPIWDNVVSVTQDKDGRYYVLDNGNNRVRAFNSDGTFIADFAANGKRIVSGPEGRLLILGEKQSSLYTLHVVPKAVENLKVVDIEGVLEITWEPIPNVEEYLVSRSTQSRPFYPYKTVSVTTFQDTDLVPSETYQYAVAGVNEINFQGDWAQSEVMTATRRKDLPIASINNIDFDSVFTAAFKYYVDNPVGFITMQNNDNKPLRNVKLSVGLKRYTDYPTEKIIKEMAAGEKRTVPVTTTFNKNVLELTENPPRSS